MTAGPSPSAPSAAPGADEAPLAGIRVLDLGQYIAGPGAAMVLAELGAEVVKVEPIGGERARHLGTLGASMVLAYNRGKRSIALDLRQPNAREVVLRLAARSDVMIQNQRPGALERLGLDARTLRERFPRLICLSVSGFGARGPSRGRPGFDIVGQAESGMMSITGEPDRMPQKVGSPIIDSATAHLGAQAVLAALFRRERTGAGATIDASLLESAMHLQAATWTGHLVHGAQPMRVGDGQPAAAPAAEPIRTLDGHVVVTAFDPAHWAALCRLIGREDMLSDPRFADNPSRVRNRDAMREALQASLGRYTSEACVALLAGAQIVVGAIRTYAQAQASADVQASGILIEARAADGSAYRTLGLPYVIDGVPRPEPAAAPEVGADTDAVLAELGYASDAIAGMRRDGTVA